MVGGEGVWKVVDIKVRRLVVVAVVVARDLGYLGNADI